MSRTTFFVVLLGALAGTSAPPARAQEEEYKLSPLLTAKPLQAVAGDDELARLQKERYNTAVEEAKARYNEFLAGRGNQDKLLAVFQRLEGSGMKVNLTGADRIAFRQRYLEMMRDVEKITKAKYDAGKVPISEMLHARYLVQDAEIQLLQTRRGNISKTLGKRRS